ncbi:MAG: radical SAM family heme chaperone HemW, partial [Lachnospiraceae bacterium]|nr:radical SAM family heme chaperone HemW [Lachnospiraceae bacterium]
GEDVCGSLSGYEVCSVFFGGGTPSLLKEGQLEGILAALRQYFAFGAGAEITVECNPGTLTKDKLLEYRQAGVNRFSLGLQSADNHELALLGRIHTWENFLSTYRLVREAGFGNVNVDIMSALPGQTTLSYERTLQQVVMLRPEHISAYSLILEEGTPFYEMYGEGKTSVPIAEPLPDEDVEREMYARTGEILRRAGYHRYEISNYAMSGRECRHNICYWDGTEYIGFGVGAASLFRGCRHTNERELSVYKDRVQRGLSVRTQSVLLSEKDRMEEFMFLGLRMMRGVSKEEFYRRFGRTMEEVYGAVLKKYLGLGLLMQEGERVFLTGRGIDVSNMVFCDFLLDV